jgi:hypothetical protein
MPVKRYNPIKLFRHLSFAIPHFTPPFSNFTQPTFVRGCQGGSTHSPHKHISKQPPSFLLIALFPINCAISLFFEFPENIRQFHFHHNSQFPFPLSASFSIQPAGKIEYLQWLLANKSTRLKPFLEGDIPFERPEFSL